MALRFVARRVAIGILTYFLTVAGFLAILNTQLEATVYADITMAVRAAMDATDLRGLDSAARQAKRDEIEAAMVHSYGLDRPFVVRVARRFVRLLQLDFGTSRSSQTAGRYGSNRVIDLIAEAFPPTLVLFVAATALSVGAGLAIGVRMAMRPGGAFDRAAVTATMFFFGTPAWWVGSFVVLVFVYELRWFPFAALHSVPLPGGAVARALDYASFLVLPTLTIAGVRCWGFAYRVRSMLLPLVDADYVNAARGRGIPERDVIRGHVLRVALPGVATQAAMLLVDSLCGDFLVEQVFARPGLGSLLWRAIRFNDITLAAGILLFLTLVFTATVVLLDVTYHLMDPRVRFGGQQAG